MVPAVSERVPRLVPTSESSRRPVRRSAATIGAMTGSREPSPPLWQDAPTRPYAPGEAAGQPQPAGDRQPQPPGYGEPPPPDYGQAPPPGYGQAPPPPDYGQPPGYGGPPPWYGRQGQGPPAGLPPVRAPETVGGPSPITIIALVLVLALLVAAGGWYFLLRPSGDAGSVGSPSPSGIVATASPSGSPLATGSTGPGTSIDPAVVAQIDQVIGSVPGVRGLQPKQEVPYRFITEGQFTAFFQQQFDKENPTAQLAAEESFDKRIGLLPADADLRDLVLQLYSSQVAAFYDPATQQFTVIQRDSAFGPGDKIVVAHEYDHALQDQYWHLDATDISDPTQGDAAAADVALVEGDATALMYEWALANLSLEELTQAVTDIASGGDQQLLDGMPLLLQRQLTFPYVDGLQFVTALQQSLSGAGGWAEVNKAWDNRPTTTEQVMHPEKYLAGEGAVSVALPDVAAALGNGWKASLTQTFGELETGIWLADGEGGASVGLPEPLPNAEAAAGWGGDRLVSLDGPNGAWAIVWQTAWDSESDAAEFSTAVAGVAIVSGPTSVASTSIAGDLPSPVLVLVASDPSALATVKAALGLNY